MSVQEDYLQDIADAIREKEGSTDPIPAWEFAERVRGLASGGRIARIEDAVQDDFDLGVLSLEVNPQHLPDLIIVCMITYESGNLSFAAVKQVDDSYKVQYYTSSGYHKELEPDWCEINGTLIHWSIDSSPGTIAAYASGLYLYAE